MNKIMNKRFALFTAIMVVSALILCGETGSARTYSTAVALVNAASYDTTVAPGSIAALFGSGMTAQDSQAAATLPLPTQLAGLRVTIGGQAAPLFFASATQVNLQVPSGVALGTAQIEVFAIGASTPTATGSVQIAESAPGVFTVDSSGRNQAAALNSDSTLNSDFDRFPGSHPETTSNFVTIFATGLGRTNPLVADGAAAPGTNFALATATASVTIGGAASQVLYSGLAPGFVGLWQINAILPATLPTNLATSLRVDLRARQSPETTLAVAKQSEYSNVSGIVLNALTGSPITNAAVTFQPSSNGKTRAAMTDAAGHFGINVINAGAYQLSAAASGFISASQNVSLAGGISETLPPIALSVPLATSEYRVVISWKSPSSIDLDAHLTGPGASGSRFHVWWNGETDLKEPATARLDRDDLIGSGPETITFTPLASGIYRLSVHNYTDRDTDGSAHLSSSGIVVRVYRGNQQTSVFTAPSGGGTLWKVFEIVNGQLTVLNQLDDEIEPSNIRVSF
jgi:uncharacterized protein (TIGR03437 family)